jgi:PadR family transcriptional regulator, regulatory protein PadR
MARRDELGPFELEVLEALLRRSRDAYGVRLIEDIAAAKGRTPSVGALYATLERLERKGFVRSAWGEPTAERGGRRKRLYTIDASGAAAVLRMGNVQTDRIGDLSPLGV